MKEIKFRGIALEGNNKGKFVYGFYAEKEHEYDDDMWETTYGIYTNEGMMFEEIEKDSACQFTGLLDKNEKEIWEGDLFIVTYSDLPNGFEYFSSTRRKKFIDVYAEVVFYNGKWTLKHKEPVDNDVVYGDLYKTLRDNPKEIQGNIFENSELISK